MSIKNSYIIYCLKGLCSKIETRCIEVHKVSVDIIYDNHGTGLGDMNNNGKTLFNVNRFTLTEWSFWHKLGVETWRVVTFSGEEYTLYSSTGETEFHPNWDTMSVTKGYPKPTSNRGQLWYKNELKKETGQNKRNYGKRTLTRRF